MSPAAMRKVTVKVFLPAFLCVPGPGLAAAAERPNILFDIFANKSAGCNMLLTGRECNDIGRPHDRGYPVRVNNLAATAEHDELKEQMKARRQ